MCAQDRIGVFVTDNSGGKTPEVGDRYIGGQFGNIAWSVSGIYAVLDMRTNKLVWQQHWPERCYSGSTVTAGGLVFVGRGDGR